MAKSSSPLCWLPADIDGRGVTILPVFLRPAEKRRFDQVSPAGDAPVEWTRARKVSATQHWKPKATACPRVARWRATPDETSPRSASTQIVWPHSIRDR